MDAMYHSVNKNTTLRDSSEITMTDQLILLGENNSQTELLAELISERLSVRCSVKGVGVCASELTSCDLLLIDCSRTEIRPVTKLLSKLHSNLSDQCPVIALLNVEPNDEFERLTEWPAVRGVFYENTSGKTLVKGITELMQSGYWLPRNVLHQIVEDARKVPSDNVSEILTPREKELLTKLLDGYTNQKIASLLHVSEHTVKTHLYNIFKKIGVKNRVQACNWAKSYL